MAEDSDRLYIGVETTDPGLLTPWFHVPPVGAVGAADLAWEAHDMPMRLLDLPLELGKNWTGAVEGDEVHFEVVGSSADLFEVEGRYEGGGLAVAFSYDVPARMFAEIALHYGGSEPWARATLVDWGQDPDPEYGVPVLDDLFLGGTRVPEEPATTVHLEVNATVTHILFGCEAGGTAGLPKAVLRPPGGESMDCPGTSAPMVGSHMTDVSAVPGEEGTWTLTLAASGASYVSVEMASMTLGGPP